MHLLEITPAEVDFFSSKPVDGIATSKHLMQRLSTRLPTILTSRLRQPVSVRLNSDADVSVTQTTPLWVPDAALATVWLTCRLGGHHRVTGVAPFVPQSLIQTLDSVLAECWLDGGQQRDLPAKLGWDILVGQFQARLFLSLPEHADDMMKWTRKLTRHV